MRFEELAALTRNHPLARGEEPYPPPPWTWHGCESFQMRVTLREAALSLLPPGLRATPERTGVFVVYSAPEGWALAPHSVALAFIEVEGYDSVDGTKGRYFVLAYWSGPAAPILNGSFSENVLSGSGWHREAGGIIRCGGGPSPGEDHFRFTMRAPQSERKGLGLTRYFLGRDRQGGVNVHATPISGDVWACEPVSVEILAVPDNPLALMEPETLLNAFVVRKVSMTCGVILNKPVPVEAYPQKVEAIMALIQTGAILLDKRGRVAELNQAARAYVGDGIVVRGGSLRASIADDQRWLDSLILPAAGNGAATDRVVALRRPSGRKPLVLRSAPAGDAYQASGTVILIADPERQSRSDPAPALQLLGLTPSEARTAALIGAGLSPREAAEVLDRSEGTIRTTLQAIYGKLDIGRQSELANLVRNLELGV